MKIRRRKRAPMRPLREELTDIPNLLTFARILTLPLVLVFIDNYSRIWSLTAALVFIAGSLTDLLDGYLARRMGRESVLGAFLDPLADKLFVLGTLVYLVAHGRVEEWLVVVLMSRELAITVLRSLAASYGLVIAAQRGGKTKTAFQTVGIVFLLIHFPYRLIWVGVELNFHAVGTWLLYLSLVWSIWSAGEYVRFFLQAVEARDRRRRATQEQHPPAS
jgi:CDP-diacylglycerol---glycerol-3-phosphate 3-phosphatidyltransferase